MTEKQRAIVNRWQMFEEENQDISTERLMAMVCDSMGVDAGDVADALHEKETSNDQHYEKD